MLKDDPQIASRQFGIVDMEGRSAGFSERRTARSRSIVRKVAEPTLLDPGNILRNGCNRRGECSMAGNRRVDRVMEMEAADAKGGDSRCSCEGTVISMQRQGPPTSHTSKAEKTDANESFNDGKYSLYISVTNEDITPQEDANPVKTLRLLRLLKGRK